MARRGRTDLPDAHLWDDVKRTIDPLRRPRRRKSAVLNEALPLPAPPADPNPKPARVRHPAPIPMPAYRALPSAPLRDETGIEPRLRRRLGRNQVEIDGTLDLHGMRQDEARAALARYLPARAARGDRTLLIITGKGLKKTDDYATVIVERGVLRAMLPVWLSEPHLAPLVAGWSRAAQGHGGDGAFYVRLRAGALLR